MGNDLKAKEMNLTASYKVVMHNDLIKAPQTAVMSLNAMKLLRTAIMNVVKQDSDFQTYCLTVSEFAELLGISETNFRRDGMMDSITDELMDARIKLQCNGKTEKFHWVSKCEYDEGNILLRLHEELKPYLLELSKLYTQYTLSDILKMKTPSSIRVYELIAEGIKRQKITEDATAHVYLSIEEIKAATGLAEKYKQFGMFKKRVIDKAVEEINENTSYFIQYTVSKQSRQVVGFDFEIMDRLTAIKRKLLVPKDNTNTQKARSNQNRRKSQKKSNETHMDSEKK